MAPACLSSLACCLVASKGLSGSSLGFPGPGGGPVSLHNLLSIWRSLCALLSAIRHSAISAISRRQHSADRGVQTALNAKSSFDLAGIGVPAAEQKAFPCRSDNCVAEQAVGRQNTAAGGADSGRQPGRSGGRPAAL